MLGVQGPYTLMLERVRVVCTHVGSCEGHIHTRRGARGPHTSTLRRALPLTLTFTLTSWLPALASASPALSLRLGGGDKLGGAHTQDSGALSTPNPPPSGLGTLPPHSLLALCPRVDVITIRQVVHRDGQEDIEEDVCGVEGVK